MEMTGKLCMEEKASSRLGRRVPAILAAHVVMGFSVVLMRLSLFGNDPFSCMNLGYAGVSGLSYGTCVIIFNLLGDSLRDILDPRGITKREGTSFLARLLSRRDRKEKEEHEEEMA